MMSFPMFSLYKDTDMEYKILSIQMLKRLPLYLNYLKSLPKNGSVNISATTIATELKLNDVQVRKDLAQISNGGRPKIGYITENLIADIEHCLGYDNIETAVLVGAGNLGRALLAYDGFAEYGIDIATAFDIDESITGVTLYGKPILSVDKLPGICSRMRIKIGIITVDTKEAQSICDLLVKSGVMAIWNFAPVHLNVPNHVLVENENLASSLGLLSKRLVEKMSTI